mgnify:CR=1 FL=1
MSNKLLSIFCLIFFLVSCKRDFIKQKSTKVKIDDFAIEKFEYKFLSTKSKIQYKNDNQLINATLNMRIENKEKIWFSVRVALGVEAARGLITRDEFIIVDRVNKQIIQSSLDIIEKEFKIALNFDQLESILTGNLLFKITENDQVLNEGNSFKVIQQNKSIQSQNLINAKTSKIEKLILFDELTNYLLTVDYENFKPLGKILFPGRHLFTSVSYLDDSSVPIITNINFEFKEVERTNSPLKFPFNIPSKYDIKKI